MTDPRNETWRPTGAEAGGLGIDGEYLPTERATAERLLEYLADRRVLFAPYEMEDPNHCAQSVLQIREFLTDVLLDWPHDTALRHHVTSLRAACREFLDAVSGPHGRPALWQPGRSHAPFSPGSAGVWIDALGRLRTHVGYHVAAIMRAYDLMVEDQLGVLLPPEPQDDDGEVAWEPERHRLGPFFGRFWSE